MNNKIKLLYNIYKKRENLYIFMFKKEISVSILKFKNHITPRPYYNRFFIKNNIKIPIHIRYYNGDIQIIIQEFRENGGLGFYSTI